MDKLQRDAPLSRPFWLLAVFLVLVFVTGGASRADVMSLAILRPVSVLLCGYAVWTLRSEHYQAFRFAFAMAAATFAFVLLQLVPLPPSIWSALPGREIMAEAEKLAGIASDWRPMTMVPTATWNALYSLFAPLAILLLAVQLKAHEHFRILVVVIALGLLSGLIGILQTISDPQGALYFYRITNNGSAVGLFANRNHQAVLLAMLFPMIAAFACSNIKSHEQSTSRLWLVSIPMLVLVPLILVTGSRAGLALGILALISCFWVYRKPAISVPRKHQSKMANWQIPVLLIGLIVLGATTFLFSRAQALERLGQANESEDNRELLVQPLLEMTSSYFPWGTGMGAFPETYAISEAFELLDQTYLNHAHNDWLELAITGGLPALILAVIMLIALVRGGFNAMKPQNKKDGAMLFVRLGFVILVILGLASVVDYPARTPTISCLAVLAAVWLYDNPIKQSDGNSKKDGTVPLPSLANALT